MSRAGGRYKIPRHILGNRDDSDILIDDQGILVVERPNLYLAEAMRAIYSFDFKPGLNKDLWWENHGLPFRQNWQQFQGLSKEDYIKLVPQPPEILPHTKPQTVPGKSGHHPIQQLYSGIPKWFRFYDDDEDRVPKPHGIDTVELYGLRAKTTLDLCSSVYKFKGCDSSIKFLFSSSVHLWFWCMAAQCRSFLAQVDEVKPVRRRDLVGKKESLRESGEELKNPQWTNCDGWVDFLDNLDRGVLGDALKDNFITRSVRQNVGRKRADPNALAVFVETERFIRNQMREGPHAASYQVVSLYSDLPHAPIELNITEVGRKLPGKRRKKHTSNKGFR